MGQDISNYATALFDLSLEQNKIEYVYEHLRIVNESMEEQFLKILSHPQISKIEKHQLIENIYQHFDKSIIHFLFVVLDNDRINDLSNITEQFNKLYNEYSQIINVIVQTTDLLDKEQLDRLKVKLMKKYRHKIEINNMIEPSIVGGMRLLNNDEVIDYTIKTQMTLIGNMILNGLNQDLIRSKPLYLIPLY